MSEDNKVHDEIRAKRITLVNDDGKPMISLKLTDGFPSITLFGKDEDSVKMDIAVDPEDGKPSIALYDQNSARVEIYIDKDGIGKVEQFKPAK